MPNFATFWDFQISNWPNLSKCHPYIQAHPKIIKKCTDAKFCHILRLSNQCSAKSVKMAPSHLCSSKNHQKCTHAKFRHILRLSNKCLAKFVKMSLQNLYVSKNHQNCIGQILRQFWWFIQNIGWGQMSELDHSRIGLAGAMKWIDPLWSSVEVCLWCFPSTFI